MNDGDRRVRSATATTWSVRSRAVWTLSGSSCMASRNPRASAGYNVPRNWARYRARTSRAVIWARCVLVAATPISRPARVYSTASASRARDESTTLVMTRTLAFHRLAFFRAWKVSTVSPDWLTPMTRVRLSRTGSR